jgi:hypothetical protein
MIDTMSHHHFKTYRTAPTSREWAVLHARLALDARLPGNPVVRDEEAIDKCVEALTSAFQEDTAAFAPKRRTRADLRPSLPPSIRDDTRLNKRFRGQWQVRRNPALKAQVNRLHRSVTYLLNEWRNEHWSDTLESLDSEDQSLWKITNRVMRVPTPSPPLQVPGGLAPSNSEKAEGLVDSLKAGVQSIRPGSF